MKELYKEIIRLRSDFLTYREIADELGCSYTLPHKVLKRYAPHLMYKLNTIKVRQNIQKIIKFRKAGISYEEIGCQFGLSKGVVEYAIRQNTPELINRRITEEEREQRKQRVIELQRQGLTNNDISKTLGLTKGAVDTYLLEARKDGVELVVKRKSYPKLTQQQLKERDKKIVMLYEQGVHPQEIADMFDIVAPRVYQIVWKEKPEINIQKRERRERRDRKIMKMVDSEVDYSEIAEKFGLSISAVYYIVRKSKKETT